VFRKINRPAISLTAKDMIHGLCEFRKIFKGLMWVEVFIVPGINDTPEELDAIKRALMEIKADKVQLNTLDRPSAEPYVTPASFETLQMIREFLKPLTTEIVASFRMNDAERMVCQRSAKK